MDEGNYYYYSLIIFFCEEIISNWFGMMWVWVNDDIIFNLWVNYCTTSPCTLASCLYTLHSVFVFLRLIAQVQPDLLLSVCVCVCVCDARALKREWKQDVNTSKYFWYVKQMDTHMSGCTLLFPFKPPPFRDWWIIDGV